MLEVGIVERLPFGEWAERSLGGTRGRLIEIG
jgi:hypothetical protein